MRIWPGQPYPLGATWDGTGVNIAVFSDNATKVEICIFESAEDAREQYRIELPEQTYHVFHGYFPDLKPGTLYGLRVTGPNSPQQGHRFNANKLLLDPYARAIGRGLTWDDSVFGYTYGDPREDLSFDERDSAPFAPLGLIVDTAFTWGNDRLPKIPWEKTIIYETHVKGFTKLLPGVPERLRGTYAGLASAAALDHLTHLGVTAVELLPIHFHIDERFLKSQGRVNYWGYNTLGFFAPDPRYCATKDPELMVQEFKSMVRTLHSAGIEVILDVVYNHSAEGDRLGPTLSWRGIDNASYYHLNPANLREYMDFTGCGNTPQIRHPRVLQLMMDSLRYWAVEMHVDGFRFDLAATLARQFGSVDLMSGFFNVIHQDPVLSQVKLIAEPWDVGDDGYQVGRFPVIWTEWNGRYRDCVRRFWKGDGGTVSELATRLAGSSDLYMDDGRRPSASINFVTCHDGFPLQDLVSYNGKHNEANGEGNRDGTNDNASWNCGAEGPTDDPAIMALRERQKRNFMATLLLSQGVPMLLSGDELGHSAQGNNNCYSQDNYLSWLNWDLSESQQKYLGFVKKLISIRKSQPALSRRHFFRGPIRGDELQEIYWLDSSGKQMDDDAWNSGFVHSLGMLLLGHCSQIDEQGACVIGDHLLVLMNAHHEAIPFTLPMELRKVKGLERLFDTADGDTTITVFDPGQPYVLQPRSMALFRRRAIERRELVAGGGTGVERIARMLED
ncbi:MAG: glycogen debranching protein GlgX [Planctomycetes bacterium]|nr:glycogen debranching protein GlgX [Planctomycetota bacterium]